MLNGVALVNVGNDHVSVGTAAKTGDLVVIADVVVINESELKAFAGRNCSAYGAEAVLAPGMSESLAKISGNKLSAVADIL